MKSIIVGVFNLILHIRVLFGCMGVPVAVEYPMEAGYACA